VNIGEKSPSQEFPGRRNSAGTILRNYSKRKSQGTITFEGDKGIWIGKDLIGPRKGGAAQGKGKGSPSSGKKKDGRKPL